MALREPDGGPSEGTIILLGSLLLIAIGIWFLYLIYGGGFY